MNKYKTEPEKEQHKVKKSKNYKAARKLLKMLNVFGIVEKDLLIKAIPFILFWSVLGLIYIANSHAADKNIREIDKTAKEIKELKSEYIITKTELMSKSIQSEVQKEVLSLGLKEATVPPKKIIVYK